MDSEGSIDVLNRLLTIEMRSLPMYLVNTSSWDDPHNEAAVQTIIHTAEDQQAMASRVARLIQMREGAVVVGEFPMAYTDLNFLSLDFLLRRLVAAQRGDVEAVRRCVEELDKDPIARELAEEILGAEKAHLEAFEELVTQHA